MTVIQDLFDLPAELIEVPGKYFLKSLCIFSVSQCGICISQCEICIPHCGFCIPQCETENFSLRFKEKMLRKSDLCG